MKNNLKDVYEKEALEKTQLTSYKYESARLRKEKILEEAKVGGNKKVLEVGCGEGQIINYINAPYKLGVDISPTRIKQAQENAEKISSQTSFLVRDAQNLSLGNEKFDLVIASELIEHLPHPKKFLQEVKKVINNNAKLILTTPNLFSLRRLIAKAIFGRSGDKTHLHIFSYKKLKRLLENEDFEILKQVPLTFEYVFYNRIPFGSFFNKLDRPLRRAIAKIFPRLSDVIFLVVKKG